METFLLNLVNYIFDSKQVSPVLKGGLVTPIYKKGEKTDPANYRGITVTSILLKVVEHIMNKRHNLILGESQSRLQKGFTAGSSSIDAALILSECIAEAKNSHKPLIVATLDAQKAFAVVDHTILLRKLFHDGIKGDNWLLLNDMYTDLTPRVKWEANRSNPIIIRQGVRQGGVLSTSHYKRYNNPLLIKVENRFTGALISHIKIPHVTVADDLAFVTHSQMEMQFMLDCGYTFAGRNRYGTYTLLRAVYLPIQMDTNAWQNTPIPWGRIKYNRQLKLNILVLTEKQARKLIKMKK